jgi:hypothetical protein
VEAVEAAGGRKHEKDEDPRDLHSTDEEDAEGSE